jgi:nicotinamidase-related amidase
LFAAPTAQHPQAASGTFCNIKPGRTWYNRNPITRSPAHCLAKNAKKEWEPSMIIERESSSLIIVDVQERLCPVMDDPRRVIYNSCRLLRGAALLEVPVTVTEQYPKGIGPTMADLRPYYDPAVTIEKITFSCTAEPTFTARMDSLNRRQAVVAGIESHVCVLQTCLGLLAAGIEVFVVEDACSSRHPSDLLRAMDRLSAAGAAIVSTEMVLFEWLARGDDPQFRTILQQLLK